MVPSAVPVAKSFTPFSYIRSFDVYSEVFVVALTTSVGASSKTVGHGSTCTNTETSFDVYAHPVFASATSGATNATHVLSIVPG